MPYNVYLAGPINGCTYGECVDWRESFADDMPDTIECLNPMRGKAFLESMGRISHEQYDCHPLSRDEGIMARDYFDCQRADVIVYNLRDADRVSIGTVMEIAWGFARQIPTIFVMEKEGNLHDHPMIRAAIKYRVDSLADAKELVKIILDVRGHK